MGTRTVAAVLLVGAVCATESVGAEPDQPAWARLSPEQIAAAQKAGVPAAFENSVGMRFVLIPAGTFMMGSRDSAAEVARRCAMPNAQPGWFLDEHPRHKVTLTSAFYMSIHEVSQSCYEAVTNPDRKDSDKRIGDDYPEGFQGLDLPVINVSWGDAEKFCRVLSQRENRQYTLPTEAQWEYACRAGTTTPFCFGETISTDQANYHGKYPYGAGPKGGYRGRPVAVGSFAPNPWGLYDLHGNVSEWCADRYGEYSAAAQTDPMGPEEGNERVVRGGSWRSYAGACRAAFRLRREAGSRSDNVGFRVCCAVFMENAESQPPK